MHAVGFADFHSGLNRIHPIFERRLSMKLKVGQKAPNFTLPSHLDTKVTLSKCLGKGPVVIAFFPLAWTPV
jgi:hypothetical protein